MKKPTHPADPRLSNIGSFSVPAGSRRRRTLSMLLAVQMTVLPGALLAQSDPFPIADQGVAMSMSSDGNNYLVGVENHKTSPTTIAAKLISPEGGQVGSLVSTDRSGISTALAFDGANHLIIWEDDELGTLNGDTGWKVYGQFISKSGSAVGAPFAITTAGIWFDGIKTMAFGAGKYLVTYTRLIVPANGGDSNNRYIAGRIVEPNGLMGNEFRISTGNGKASDVAFDGARFFVVWCEDVNDRDIRGRYVSPDGVLGVEISVSGDVAPSDNPKSVAFDGTNYLIVWNEEVDGRDTGTWDVFGQLVSPNGVLVGSRIAITTESGPQMVTTVAFDNSHYLAVWVDMLNEADWDLYGQFISPRGSCIGSKVPLSTDAGNQLGGVGFAGGKYLLLVNNGVVLGEGGIREVDGAVGLFVEPLPSLQIHTNDGDFGVKNDRFGFNITGPAGQPIVVEARTSLAVSGWTPVQTNTLGAGVYYFSDPQWKSFQSRLYRLSGH